MHFAAPEVADYACTADTICVTPVVGATAEMVDALLIATALPAALWLDGAFLLHASAVVPRGEQRALAIAGVSGSGKSHLAAALLDRGADLVADDSLAIRATANGVQAAGLAGGYHVGAFGTTARDFIIAPRCRSTASLAAVVVLDGDGEGKSVAPLDALAAFLAHRHRANAARHAGLEARALRDAALLVRDVPVYSWPRNRMDALLDEDLIRTIMTNGRRR